MTLPDHRRLRAVWQTAAATLFLVAAVGGAPVSTVPVATNQPEQPDDNKKNPPLNPDMPPTDAANSGDKPPDKDEWYSIHAQSTFVGQANGQFHAPYTLSPLSLPPQVGSKNTATGTLFFDLRLWQGAELIFNPEYSGGTGLNGTTGIAGFPNGEATRVGAVSPTPYIARLLVRQTIGLNGDVERIESAQNMLAGYRDIDRLTFTFGKQSATDTFDDNRFSHDPRSQFMNWSNMYDGAWDYPANTRGYTYGGTAEFNTRYFAFRYGIFGEPSMVNGPEIDPKILKANGQIWEFEERYMLGEQPGKLREWVFMNQAHMGSYREAIAMMPVDPDVSQTRAYRIKYGFGFNLEQQITTDLGAFLRAGWNDGQEESWAFTEIDRAISTGLLLKGTAWRRPKDETGIAGVINGLSDAHRDYLAAGGLGFIIGDRRLNYEPEEILEVYYNCELREGVNVTADFQGVNNPAYNHDRGPVAIFAIRFHLAF